MSDPTIKQTQRTRDVQATEVARQIAKESTALIVGGGVVLGGSVGLAILGIPELTVEVMQTSTIQEVTQIVVATTMDVPGSVGPGFAGMTAFMGASIGVFAMLVGAVCMAFAPVVAAIGTATERLTPDEKDDGGP